MGASKIVAIGKPGAKLNTTKDLGATDIIALSDETDWTAAADVDVVLDYLYGTVAERAVPGILMKRANKNKRLSWVHIGALAGDEARISGTILRKTNVVFMGCGPGSWSFGELYAQLPVMLEAMVQGGFKADFKVEKLSEIESWWGEADGLRRLVKPQ
jgi:Zn-dependent alcohol dehydrogenase